MDQCFLDLMDKGEQINLPAIMIHHIARIANTTSGMDSSLVFEHFGVVLQKKIGVQMVDETGGSTLMGCDFTLAKGEHTATDQGPRTLFPPVPGTSSSEPYVDALLQD